jgi:hypothetical protein
MITPQSTGDEDTAVRRQNATEVRVVLERRDEAIRAECQHAEAHREPSPVLSDALPNQPRAADFSQSGDNEEDDRSEHGHGGRAYKRVAQPQFHSKPYPSAMSRHRISEIGRRSGRRRSGRK